MPVNARNIPHYTVFDNGAQDFSDTPGLRETSTRAVWRISVKNLRNLADTGFGQVTGERLKPRSNLILNLLSITVHFEIRVEERPE
jgi:hypothetical protein